MATITQATLLGAERLASAPTPPHATLGNAWAQLDWTGAREMALLEACALAGAARVAGALPAGPLAASEPAAVESAPSAPSPAVTVLRQLLAVEWHGLLPEWLELCGRRRCLVPPFFLPRLFDIITAREDRALLPGVIGERGYWLARQNPAWNWVLAGEPVADVERWETGSEDERVACMRILRATDPSLARELAEKTWAEDTPEFRVRVLGEMRSGLSTLDEVFLTRALTDRRKEVRASAQALLAALDASSFSTRMAERADRLLTMHRGLLSRKLEVALPAAYDPAWKADGVEQKPPTGVGEKAFWALQILALVPMRHWRQKFGLTAPALIDLARKSADWCELLMGAWFRAATLHRDSEAGAALLEAMLGDAKLLPTGVNLGAATGALLPVCAEADRWRLVAAHENVAWVGLDAMSGAPTLDQGRALLQRLAPDLRSGFNSGGSPMAVVAARRVPPTLRAEAERLLTRDNGFSKPAETFLQALNLRASMHDAFSTPDSQPSSR